MLLAKFVIVFVCSILFTGYSTKGQTTNSNCSASKNRFLCNNSQCLASYYRCDLNYDCQDGSDEEGCTCDAINNKFQCNNGRCISYHNMCNRINDCGDGSDEINCPCNDSFTFRCNNGMCLHSYYKCDFVDQCGDSSDEDGCPCDTSRSFTCKNNKCIDAKLKCNLIDDCGDGSDEEGCFKETVALTEFNSQKTGYLNVQLDNQNWYPVCAENWSLVETNVVCRQLGYYTGKFIPYPNLSNPGNDTHFLTNVNCSLNPIPTQLKDCRFDIVETSCLVRVGLSCSQDRYNLRLVGGRTASQGRLQIYWEQQWMTVCRNKIATRYYNSNYSTEDLVCRELGFAGGMRMSDVNNTNKVRNVSILEAYIICEGNEESFTECVVDELASYQGECTHDDDIFLRCYQSSNDISQQPNIFQCSNGQYIDRSCLCDSYVDCMDGGDEQCPCNNIRNSFICENSNCIYKNRVCDHYDDCGDWSDEMGCACDGDKLFQCDNSKCLLAYNRCNDVDNCGDGSDEIGCPCNNVNKFLCSNGKCISSYQKCNLVDNCGDNSDETGCFDGDVFLYSGFTKSAGFLIIKINDQWHSVSSYGWITNDTNIACRGFGYTRGSIGSSNDLSYSLTVYMTPRVSVTCRQRRNAGRIKDCDITLISNSSLAYNEYGLVKLKCDNGPNVLRLVGGNSSYGRLQFQIDSNWTTVCADGWTSLNSRIACKDLGFSYGILTNNIENTHVGEDVPIGLDGVICSYSNVNLSDCSRNQYYVHNCRHSEDVFLRCYSTCRSTNQTFLCGNGNCIERSWMCNKQDDCGDDSDEQICDTYPKPLRLVGGNETYGQLQIQIGSVWATVCDDSWNDLNSRIACQQLGFQYGTISYNTYSISTGNDDPIGLDDVQCNGTERYITDCYHRPYFQHNCDHYEDVFLTCSKNCNTGIIRFQCNNGDCISLNARCDMYEDCRDGSDEIGCSCSNSNQFKCNNEKCVYNSTRCNFIDNCGDSSDENGCFNNQSILLYGTGNITSGVLMVKINNKWLSVCRNGWSNIESNVVCRQLGFLRGRLIEDVYLNQQTRLPQTLTNISCVQNPNTSNIQSCSYSVSNNYTCASYPNSVILRCYANNPKKIRLVGNNETYGRLQIQNGNNWTTLCSDFWSNINAEIACRQLGFAYGQMSLNYDNNFIGSDVPVGSDYFVCSMADQYLSDCIAYPYYNYYYYCTHNKDVFLTCFKNCSADMFTCINGGCIERTARCNSINDCGDNSDEISCILSSTSTANLITSTCHTRLHWLSVLCRSTSFLVYLIHFCGTQHIIEDL